MSEQEQPAANRRRSVNGFLRSWAWKREHRPDKVRFARPYSHPFCGGQLTIHQQKFKAEGFATTVWDSSIVLSKYYELQAKKNKICYFGKRCLDLSAGCGLPGIVLSKLGAAVTATDLAPNLPLLEKNAKANGCSMEVKEHAWGTNFSDLCPPFDLVCACDVMYIAEAVEPLVTSLVALSGPGTQVLIAYGRNRQAESQFFTAARQHFTVETMPDEELDEVYQCIDVDVLHLRLKPDLKNGQEASRGKAPFFASLRRSHGLIEFYTAASSMGM